MQYPMLIPQPIRAQIQNTGTQEINIFPQAVSEISGTVFFHITKKQEE